MAAGWSDDHRFIINGSRNGIFNICPTRIVEKNISEIKLWHGRIFRYVPLILCIALILFASTTQASMNNTSRIIRPILEFLFPDATENTLFIYHSYIRKLAHLTEYAILAFFAARFFRFSGKDFLKKYWYLFALTIVLLIASIDEINQSFNPTRIGSGYDVLLDFIGGLIMIGFILIVGKVRKVKSKK
jgi:VanZ family protein